MRPLVAGSLSAQEWLIVAQGDASRADMRAGRRVRSLAELAALPLSRSAALEEAEVAAVVLYTGPMVRDPRIA